MIHHSQNSLTKISQLTNGILRHFEVSRDLTWALAIVTKFDVPLWVTENRGPKQTCFQYLRSCLICIILSFHESTVTLPRNLPYFLMWNAPSNNLIYKNPKKMRILPYIVFHIRKEFLLLKSCYILMKNPPNKTVSKICEQRCFNLTSFIDDIKVPFKKRVKPLGVPTLIDDRPLDSSHLVYPWSLHQTL